MKYRLKTLMIFGTPIMYGFGLVVLLWMYPALSILLIGGVLFLLGARELL